MIALNGFGILGGLFMFYFGYLTLEEINDLYLRHYWNSFVFGRRDFDTALQNILLNGAFYYILISIFYGILFTLNIKRIPVKSNRAISYIGIVISIIVFILSIFVIEIYGDIYFPLIYWSWIGYGFLTFVFSLVLLIISIKHFRGPKKFEEDDEVLYTVETDLEVE